MDGPTCPRLWLRGGGETPLLPSPFPLPLPRFLPADDSSIASSTDGSVPAPSTLGDSDLDRAVELAPSGTCGCSESSDHIESAAAYETAQCRVTPRRTAVIADGQLTTPSPPHTSLLPHQSPLPASVRTTAHDIERKRPWR